MSSSRQRNRLSVQRNQRLDLTRGRRQPTLNGARKSLYMLRSSSSQRQQRPAPDKQVAQVVVRELYSKKTSNTTFFVKFIEYVEFWRLMENSNEAASFAARLIKLIVTVLKNITKHKNMSFLCDLVHTLHYVDLMFTFEGDNKSELEEQIQHFESTHVGHQLTKGSELALNVVQGIKRRHFGKAGFIADTLQESVMINDATSSDPVFDHLDLDFDFPYTFFYLCRLIRTPFADDIYRQIQRLLHTYPTQTLLMSPQRIQKVCLKLLFLLIEFLAVQPPSDLAILKQLKVTVKTFYFWPRPYGTFSKKILEILDTEIQTPGSFAFARIANQNPMLGRSASKLLSALGEKQMRKRARMQQTVWVYSDSNDVRANLAVNLMNLDAGVDIKGGSGTPSRAFDALTLRLQVDIIVNIVTRDLQILKFPVRHCAVQGQLSSCAVTRTAFCAFMCRMRPQLTQLWSSANDFMPCTSKMLRPSGSSSLACTKFSLTFTCSSKTKHCCFMLQSVQQKLQRCARERTLSFVVRRGQYYRHACICFCFLRL